MSTFHLVKRKETPAFPDNGSHSRATLPALRNIHRETDGLRLSVYTRTAKKSQWNTSEASYVRGGVRRSGLKNDQLSIWFSPREKLRERCQCDLKKTYSTVFKLHPKDIVFIISAVGCLH